ncbi:hypothetical protein [Actinomadura sp. 7K507]|uniref:hypothetical protein n=1 Tax=Actinomadura sp. 7K507 TaxID=2530365 RepID=UPI001045DDA0|nr:hypothetical protein [Actinomadura sp. 7K507]TDC86061.1 hypothetical protein E1285_24025 [Actinomadura sp. 7K507]
MAERTSRRPDEAAGHSLHYESAPPSGLILLGLVLAVGALIPPAFQALEAGVPSYVISLVGVFIGVLPNFLRRRVTLTADRRLVITGFRQHVDVDASRINAITVSRRGRLKFGSAVAHWDGGKFPIWQAMRYTPVPRSSWSLKYVSGRGGKDFGDMVYRLRVPNPALIIDGVEPPAWALPPVTPQPPLWY